MKKHFSSAISPVNINKEKGCNNTKAGSNRTSEPRLVGGILTEMLRSNSRLAQSYRKFLAAKLNAEKGEKENG